MREDKAEDYASVSNAGSTLRLVFQLLELRLKLLVGPDVLPHEVKIEDVQHYVQQQGD